MAGWDEIITELGKTPNQIDYVRNQYLKKLPDLTKRNVIAYYSGFLNGKSNHVDLDDNDMNGFMNALRGMDCKLGLDLILHTPGGYPVAAEAIVNYLRNKFDGDIRVIVPQMAMSAGTMIACSAKSIIMGKESSLGPIDPQFNGIPAYDIVNEFKEAKKDLANNPNNVTYWSIQLNKYPPAFVNRAQSAIDLSTELVRKWLQTGMFQEEMKNDRNSTIAKIQNVVNKLNEHSDSKEHGRHFDADFCKNTIGLKIDMLEDDNRLQDAVLSIHHAFMLTLANTPTSKIIQAPDKPWLLGNS